LAGKGASFTHNHLQMAAKPLAVNTDDALLDLHQ
jgi:hypothetical protein